MKPCSCGHPWTSHNEYGCFVKVGHPSCDDAYCFCGNAGPEAVMTIRERIVSMLEKLGTSGDFITASTMQKSLKNVKLASLSSRLKRMVDDGTLERQKGVGPRGGYGYRLKRQEGPPASRQGGYDDLAEALQFAQAANRSLPVDHEMDRRVSAALNRPCELAGYKPRKISRRMT